MCIFLSFLFNYVVQQYFKTQVCNCPTTKEQEILISPGAGAKKEAVKTAPYL